MLLAKCALGVGGTIAVFGAYTCREGFVHVSVDEHFPGGSHVHVIAPAALIPMAVHFVPQNRLEDASQHAEEWLPAVRVLTKELQKFPDTDFVEVRDARQHVQIRTRGGKLLIDVEDPGQTVHVAVPLATIDDLSRELAAKLPGA